MTDQKPRWNAWLGLRVKNMPRLMRQGLYWSRANILADKGFVMLHRSDPELTE
jgi:hypothetical protein